MNLYVSPNRSNSTLPAPGLVHSLPGVVLCSLLATVGIDSDAAAQTTGSEGGLALEEIMVTARRREESLQTTPVAVSALSAEDLTNRGVQSVDAVSQFVPNVQFDAAAALSGGAYNATVFIRGVGQNDFAIFSDPGVAMYIDGVYLGRTIGGIIDVLDMSRVEVLRGPQGTLFGRNTIGGAVNIVSQQPGEEFGGELSVTGGRFDRLDAKGVLNLPLAGGRLLTRWMAATINRDGYAKRILTGEDLGDKNTDVARAQAAMKLTDSLDASLVLDASRTRQHSAPLTLVDVAAAGFPFQNIYNAIVAPQLNIVAPNGQSTVNGSWITGDIDQTYATGLNVNNLNTRGAALTLDWEISDGIRFKSISAYRELEALFARDGDNTPFTFRETVNDDDQDQFSQEFQLAGAAFDERLNWLIGAYYFDETAAEVGKANLALGTFSALEALPASRTFPPGPPARFGGPGNPANVGLDIEVDLNTRVWNESYALFTQGTYRFTDQWSVTAGLRWTEDNKKISMVHRRMGGSNAFVVNTTAPLEDSWSQLTPKLGVEFQATDDVMLYASFAEGYKSGGFNGRPLVGSALELLPYDPETVSSYELGAKTSWLDNRLTLNLAAFFNDYEDMQLSINATPQNFVRNAGAAETKGVELELVARLARGLDFNMSAGYLDAKYTQLDPQLATLNPPLRLDYELVKAPQWTLSSGLQYALPIGNFGDLTLRGDWSYKSKVYHDVFNDERLAQPAFSIYNAYTSFRTADQVWTLALFGTNLADERYRISGNSSLGFGLAESTFAAPREWGATVSYRF